MLSPAEFTTALRGAWQRFNEELGWARSSHVALFMMMALFPFCVFVLSMAVQLSAGIDKEEVIDLVFRAWPDEIAEPIVKEVLAVLEQSSARTALIGALLAMYFASNGVDAVRLAITHAYREDDPRPWWKTRLLALVFVFLGTIILCFAGLVSVGVPLYFRFVSDTAPDLYSTFLTSEALRTAFGLGALMFAVYAAHAWLPGRKHRLKTILPGVVLTIVLWVAAGAVFGSYLRSFGDYSVTYAGLAGIMAALVYMYLMSVIFVFSAEVNGQIMRMRQQASVRKAT